MTELSVMVLMEGLRIRHDIFGEFCKLFLLINRSRWKGERLSSSAGSGGDWGRFYYR